MKKILYIRIDNAPVPQVLKDEIEEFDCRQINDFCSFVGDVIIGDLRDNDGTPYYRLIRPVGQLLMNFRIENAKLFDTIVSQWADILGDILHKGFSENEPHMIKFPHEYVDWLCLNEDDHFSHIGNNLKKNNATISLDVKELHEDVISILRLKIEKYLQTNKNVFDYIVFSNPHIGNVSESVKRLKDVFGSFHFLKLEQLVQIFEDDIREKYRGHEYVDLGLSSGLKWATYNIGALEPSDGGEYYTFGGTTAVIKKVGKHYTYDHLRGAFGGNQLYDAASANWGGTWRMPTASEFRELIDECTWEWTSQNDHCGYFVKGPSGGSIFLPAVDRDYIMESKRWDISSDYWSCSPFGDENGYLLKIYSTDKNMYIGGNGRGCRIRAVSE